MYTAVIFYSDGTDYHSSNYGSEQEAIDAVQQYCRDKNPAHWIDTGSGNGHVGTTVDCTWSASISSGECAAYAKGLQLDSDGKISGNSSTTYSIGFGRSIGEADYDAIAKNGGYSVQVLDNLCQS
ncbi:hypothetical protein ACFXHA_25860 [Nocardia sp. NPDC059240]|uniref:hypothetical protein n=1 Tax=Nocardia sp. NPDC059240 TaxID=3346786 RepID=UPI0036D1528F